MEKATDHNDAREDLAKSNLPWAEDIVSILHAIVYVEIELVLALLIMF